MGIIGQGITPFKNRYYNGSYGGRGKRYFSTLDGSTQYYTIPTVTLTGGFDVYIDVSTITDGKMVLSGGTGSTGIEMYIQTGGTLRIYYGGASIVVWGAPAFTDGKLNILRLNRVGTTLTGYVNGTSLGSVTLSGNCQIYALGTRSLSGSLLFNGVLANNLIYDHTVSTTVPIRNYKINEDFSTTSTVIDYGSDGSNGTAANTPSSELFTLVGSDWLGAELVLNPNFIGSAANFTLDAGWFYDTNKITDDGTTNDFFRSDVSPAFEKTKRYKTEIIVSGMTTGIVYAPYDGTNPNGALIVANGTYIRNYTPPNNGSFWSYGKNGFDGSVERFSVKRILQAP